MEQHANKWAYKSYLGTWMSKQLETCSRIVCQHRVMRATAETCWKPSGKKTFGFAMLNFQFCCRAKYSLVMGNSGAEASGWHLIVAWHVGSGVSMSHCWWWTCGIMGRGHVVCWRIFAMVSIVECWLVYFLPHGDLYAGHSAWFGNGIDLDANVPPTVEYFGAIG